MFVLLVEFAEFAHPARLGPEAFSGHVDQAVFVIDWHTINGMFEKSKELEKNQISEAYRSGVEDDVIWNPLRTGEMYYNDTFG